MGVLRDRLLLGDGPASLRSSGTLVTEVVDRLAGSELPVKLIGQGGLTAADLIAALAHAALGDDDAIGPTLVQARPRHAGAASLTVRARLGRGLSRRASPGQALPCRRSPPDPRLLGRQP